MSLKAKCLHEGAPGFTKGESYDVLGVGETVNMLMNDDGKITGIGHAAMNDSDLWSLESSEDGEPKAKADKSGEKK